MADSGQGRPLVDGVDFFVRAWDWPPETPEMGHQCMSCGFLAKRSIDPAHPGVEEVTVEDRKSGRLFALRTGIRSIPWCFIRPTSEVDLQREVERAASASRDRQREQGIPDVMQVSFPESDVNVPLCPEWFYYRQFLSPAEHREERNMLRLKEMERQQAENNLALAEALKGIAQQTLDIAAQTKQIHEDAQKSSTKTDDFMSRWTRVAVGLAVAALAIAALGYFAPDFGRQIVSNLTGARPTP
jgi:hypothetical protein